MVSAAIRAGSGLAVLLAATACATGHADVPAAADVTGAVATASGAGLPGLPAASGSAGSGGQAAALPPELRRVLLALGCAPVAQADAQVLQVPNAAGGQDVMATDRQGPGYRYWLRTFGGSGKRTGYLVQLNGCPATSNGMRAYIDDGSSGLQEVTAQLLAQSVGPSRADMAGLSAAGAGELFALQAPLQRVPVLRWVAEADPDRPLPRTAHTFAQGALVHGGFVLWKDGQFQAVQRVGRDSWPCDGSQMLPCADDPFVTP